MVLQGQLFQPKKFCWHWWVKLVLQGQLFQLKRKFKDTFPESEAIQLVKPSRNYFSTPDLEYLVTNKWDLTCKILYTNIRNLGHKYDLATYIPFVGD